MIWVYKKQDLSFYGNIPDKFCYCEMLSSAGDMYLQGQWSPSNAPYTASLAVWSVDGNTAYEVVDPILYSVYFGVNPFNGQHYFTIRLKSLSPAMCEHKCFLMRVGVVNDSGQIVFAAYTERYCIASCCEYAQGISIAPDGSIHYVTPTPVSGSEINAVGTCGNPLVRLITTSDCWNAFTQEYFGKPATVLSGTYFQFVKISTFEGRIRQRPRAIEIQRSYNCRVQRIESARQYEFEGSEYFPTWKMDEIESQLSSNNIWIDNYSEVVRCQYDGGTPFTRYEMNVNCADIFKLRTFLTGCTTRQIFGCLSSCDASNGNFYFVVPESYSNGYFYNSSSEIIATDVPTLVNWFVANNMDAQVVGLSPKPCVYTEIIQVNGAIIPAVIYYDEPTPSKAISPLSLENTDNICDYIAQSQCAKPVIGTITYGIIPCDAPIIGVVTYGDITGEDVVISGQNGWVLDSAPDTEGQVYVNVVSLNIAGTKTISGIAGTLYVLTGELIAQLSGNATPTGSRVINYSPDFEILIGIDGTITINGQWIVDPEDTITIDFNSLTYNIV